MTRVLWLADENSAHVQRWLAPLAQLGIEPVIITMPVLRPRFRYLFELNRIRKAVAAFQPDIIHAHYASSYGVLSTLISHRAARVTSVWGSDVLSAAERGPLYRLLLRRALRKPDLVITNSEYLLSAANAILPGNYRHIPFGIDCEQYPYIARGPEAPTNFTIGCFKRLHRVAGIDLLLNALTEVQQALPEKNIRLLIAGDGPERAQLEGICSVQNLAQVEFLGHCSNEKIRQLNSTVDLAVYPSRVEGLGISIIESMCSGVPVVANNIGGLQQLLGAGKNGWQVDSHESLAGVIISSIRDYRDSLVRAEKAADYVREVYDIRKSSRALVEIYRLLVQDTGTF